MSCVMRYEALKFRVSSNREYCLHYLTNVLTNFVSTCSADKINLTENFLVYNIIW